MARICHSLLHLTDDALYAFIPQVIRRREQGRTQVEHETVLYFNETPMKLKLPLVSGPDEVSDVLPSSILKSMHWALTWLHERSSRSLCWCRRCTLA